MAMREFFTAMWRTIMLRGLASLIFGILAFAIFRLSRSSSDPFVRLAAAGVGAAVLQDHR